MSVDAPTFTPPTLVPVIDSPNGSEALPIVPENCIFEWEAPPEAAPRGRSASAGAQEAEWFSGTVLPQLQAAPGRYAKVFSYTKRGSASSRLKRLRQQYPGVSFLSRASGSTDGKPTEPQWSVVYAAWLDGGEEPVPAE